MGLFLLEKVSFEIAQRLKSLDFPQPEEIKKGQLWYRPDGKPVLIENENLAVTVDIDLLPNKNRAAIYAPNIEDFVRELPDWGISIEGTEYVCSSDKFEEYGKGKTELEAWANAWIKQKGKVG